MRVEFEPNGHVKIFVGDFAVLVDVEVVEHALKVFFGDLDAPEVEIEL